MLCLTQNNIMNLLQVRENCGSDLFMSDYDDDVADHDYVQPSNSSSNNDEPPLPSKKRRKRHRATSLWQPRVPRLPDPESSDKAARNLPCGSRVSAMTRMLQEVTTSSVVPVLVSNFMTIFHHY